MDSFSLLIHTAKTVLVITGQCAGEMLLYLSGGSLKQTFLEKKKLTKSLLQKKPTYYQLLNYSSALKTNTIWKSAR